MAESQPDVHAMRGTAPNSLKAEQPEEAETGA